MQLTPAMNCDQWVSHFACYFTDVHLGFTHQRKSAATEIIHQVINLIETRFSRKVVFIRSNGEKSLGDDFDKFLIDKEITFEVSAHDTPVQTGHSERKGGILAMKARALRIDAGLSINLWPEIIKRAGYLANRTPMAKHGWKSLYELMIGQTSNLSYLHQYGCKAYSLIKHLPRKAKLAERAHIGHLVCSKHFSKLDPQSTKIHKNSGRHIWQKCSVWCSRYRPHSGHRRAYDWDDFLFN